jgi:ribosome-binding protein aMBF1 (putative translation factor)
MTKKRIPYSSFDDDLREELKNPKFRAAFEKAGERVETAYAIVEMRHKAKMTQKELAKKMKVSQSVVARIEQGSQNLTISTLMKLAGVCGKKLKIKFI